MKDKIVVYGCYGYTGRLTVDELLKLNIKPVLSGRNAEKVEALASELGLEARPAKLEKKDLDQLLAGAKVIVHCAGPFIHTAKDMMEACIRNGTHYTDITGEIDVFQLGHGFDTLAKQADVVILPGTGFDIVPSDCLAAHLHSKLGDANDLEMAFFTKGRASRGTSLTVVEGLGKGGMIRENRNLKPVKDAFDVKSFQFGPYRMNGVTIPWGDVFTAFISTGIPNVRVYMGMPDKVIGSMKMGRWFGPILRSNFVKDRMRKKIIDGKPGPSERSLAEDHVYLTGTVKNERGESASADLKTPSGYKLTAMTAAKIAQKLGEDHRLSGFQTPSLAFGKDFILEFEGVERTDR